MIQSITPAQAFAIAANIRDGENPAYTAADFRAAMPAFSADIIPDEALQGYVDMASAVVKEARWHSLWKEGMRLFIAHFVTLYLGSPDEGATPQQIRNAGKIQGNATQKHVGNVSLTYDAGSTATSDLTGWAAFKLTTYGVQFATLAKLIGKGGMYVR